MSVVFNPSPTPRRLSPAPQLFQDNPDIIIVPPGLDEPEPYQKFNWAQKGFFEV